MSEFNLNEFINDSVPFFPERLLLSTEDVMCLSNKIDQLTIDVNTQNLKIELKTLKRQKLCRSIKQLKSEIFSLKQIVTQKQSENDLLREQMLTLSTTLFGELSCLTQCTHCSLGRIHHILIASIPHIVMSEEEHQELLRALQLIRTVIHYEEYV